MLYGVHTQNQEHWVNGIILPEVYTNFDTAYEHAATMAEDRVQSLTERGYNAMVYRYLNCVEVDVDGIDDYDVDSVFNVIRFEIDD